MTPIVVRRRNGPYRPPWRSEPIEFLTEQVAMLGEIMLAETVDPSGR